MKTTVERHTEDQRQGRRSRLALSGCLYYQAEQTAIPCTIINLSMGGAGILCEQTPPAVNASVVLYVEGFGRFEAVTRHSDDEEAGLEFICGAQKRMRLADDLAHYLQHGLQGITRTRRHVRVSNAAHARLTLANKEEIECELIDVSLQGARIKTSTRPSLGEVVLLGRTRGEVVRHESDGIALQFMQST